MRVIPIRALVIIVTVVLFVATILAAALAAFADVKFGLPTPDKTTVINTVVAVGAFVLVAWGVVVALAAYVSATGTPELSVEFNLPYRGTDLLFVQAQEYKMPRNIALNRDYPHRRFIDPDEQNELELVINNGSKYSARNPGVRLTLVGIGGLSQQMGWTTILEDRTLGPQVIQWDGGTDYIIHGQWSRNLPTLRLSGMCVTTDDPVFVVDWAADGFGPKTKTVPVTVTADREQYDGLKELTELTRASMLLHPPSFFSRRRRKRLFVRG